LTYDFSSSLKGTLTRTVAPGVRGTPAKLKPAGSALAENASDARVQKIFATRERRFLDARITWNVTTTGPGNSEVFARLEQEVRVKL
jgi:hypothetical protein